MPTLIEKLSSGQVLAEAQKVAANYYVPKVMSARMSPEQGMFSRTAIVTLEDNSQVVVQLKDSEIDTTKVALAHSLLGDVVPLIHAAHTTKAYYAYVVPYIPGELWDLGTMKAEKDDEVAKQIGRLIAGCYLGIDSGGMVDRFIVPRLKHILVKEIPSDPAIRSWIERAIAAADGLRALPLALCHWDINSRNIILNEEGTVVGLIDWEQANLLPVGMNAWCIRYLSVPIFSGKDKVVENSLAMAEAFWNSFIAHLPANLHHLKRQILDSMQVGFVLQTFWEGGAAKERNLTSFVERMDWLETTFTALFEV